MKKIIRIFLFLLIITPPTLVYGENFETIKEVKISPEESILISISISLDDCQKECSKEYLIEILTDKFLKVHLKREGEEIRLNVRYLGMRV